MVFFCLVLFLELLQMSTSSFINSKFNQKCLPDTRLLFMEDLSLTTRSVQMCAGFCSKDDKCLAMAFSKVTGACLIYRAVAYTSCSNTVTDPGYTFYEKVQPCYGNLICNPCQNGGSWNGVSCTCPATWLGQFCEKYPTDCSELFDSFPSERGGFKVYSIQPLLSKQPFKVKCYMEWGGYTYIIDRTHNGTEINFNRNWHDYKFGFGDTQNFINEFWLGLEHIFAITSSQREERSYTLDFTIRLEKPNLRPNFEYFQSYYSNFWIENESEGYRIHIDDYSTNTNVAGDSLLLSPTSSETADGQMFSTFDADNDQSTHNCADMFQGGWWFNDCTAGCPTCPRVSTPSGYRDNSVASMFWKYDLDDYSIARFDVKMVVK